MNLGFRTKWPSGNPTFFVEKIWTSLRLFDLATSKELSEYKRHYQAKFDESFYMVGKPKIHTIREDKKSRWKAGMKIHFVIHNRTKKRFQFAPIIPVISVQEIRIECPTEYLNDQKIYIDDRLLSTEEMQHLAWNDGFKYLAQFQMWFNTDFSGRIIHWTNLKY